MLINIWKASVASLIEYHRFEDSMQILTIPSDSLVGIYLYLLGFAIGILTDLQLRENDADRCWKASVASLIEYPCYDYSI